MNLTAGFFYWRAGRAAETPERSGRVNSRTSALDNKRYNLVYRKYLKQLNTAGAVQGSAIKS